MHTQYIVEKNSETLKKGRHMATHLPFRGMLLEKNYVFWEIVIFQRRKSIHMQYSYEDVISIDWDCEEHIRYQGHLPLCSLTYVCRFAYLKINVPLNSLRVTRNLSYYHCVYNCYLLPYIEKKLEKCALMCKSLLNHKQCAYLSFKLIFLSFQNLNSNCITGLELIYIFWWNAPLSTIHMI